MIIRLAFVILFSAASFAQPFWPTRGWRTSTPEQQGMDSNKLAEAVEFILRNNVRVHSLLVIRNGFIVADAHFYPYLPNSRHDVASVTKSVTSTLIGIAIDKGIIKDVSQPALGLFTDRKAANLDEHKKTMTVEHLLLMESGLACVNSPTEETLFRMMESPDWIQFMLDLPMSDAPGTRFVYNSGAVHLLSAIVRKTAGMNALEFARRHLFEPLGITDVIWPLDPRGEDNHGWGDLQLRPHDMAKIGYLFLNNGRWEGKQVLSARGVQAATQRRVSLVNGESYGYLWWMPGRPPGLIEARGRGGQRIIIWPERKIVIVFTGGGFEPGRVGSFLIEAVKSDQPLAPDPGGVSRLESSIKRAAEPPTAAKGEGTALPETAKVISGKRFVLEPNPRGVQSLTLTFKDQGEAVLNLALVPGVSDKPQLEFRLGLDGVPRLAPGRFDIPVACKGVWKTQDTFVVEIDEVGNINRFSLELTFWDGQVTGKIAEKTGLGSIPIQGEIK
jgi:CubicO group peptidase (beta-lactamase class C family)